MSNGQDDSKKGMTRRKALGVIGAAPAAAVSMATPMKILLESVFSSLLREAHAQDTGGDLGSNFFSVYLNGGPGRWTFDSPLRLYANDPFIPSPMIATKFKQTGDGIGIRNDIEYYTGVTEYATTTVGSYQFPHLWNSLLPFGSSTVPMKDLAQHMLIMRGYSTPGNGHANNQRFQTRPMDGVSSLGGLAGDYGKAPFAGVTHNGAHEAYYSSKGLNLIVPQGNDLILDLLGPLLDSSNLTSNRQGVRSTIDAAINAFRQSSSPMAKPLYASREKAALLFNRSFDGYNDVYDTLSKKYAAIVRRVITDKSLFLAGVDDKPIFNNSTSDYRFRWLTDTGLPVNKDFRDAFLVHQQVTMPGLIPGFVLAEFLFTEGLTNFVSTLIPYINFPIPGAGTCRLIGDHHFSGCAAVLYLHSMQYRIFSACLLELINQLKARTINGKPVFDNTVIQLTGDFTRAVTYKQGDDPKVEKESGHLWAGCNTSFWSGTIQEPLVVGNIRTAKDKDGTYMPTNGLAAPVPEFDGRSAGLGTLISTVSALLKIPSPSPNNMSFVRIQNNRVISNISSNGGKPTSILEE